MSVLNVLGVTLTSKEYEDEFLQMVTDSLRVCREDANCQYIEAWKHPANENEYMLVSIWNSEDALMEWYRSPFHVDLRKRGMQGLLAGYFSHQGEVAPNKSHAWTRPQPATKASKEG